MIKIKNFVTDYKIEDLLAIDQLHFREAIAAQPSNYATAALAHSEAYLQAADLKAKRNLLEGKLDERIRNFYNTGLVEGAPDAKTKSKLTEAQIQAKIQSDPEYCVMVNACNEAESYLRLAEAMLEAMKHRRDMLNNLTALNT